MTEFFDYFLNIDTQILLWFNGLNTPLLDNLMWNLSDRFIWIPFYIFLTFYIFKKTGTKRSVICYLLIALLIFTADQVCASLIRPAFERLRPSSELNPVSSLLHFANDYRGGSFGFPSCHAANTFALAVFLSLVIRDRWMIIALMVWATVVSCSRIYLGVHYPTDVLAGASIGALAAVLYYNLYLFLAKLDYNFQFNGIFKRIGIRK